MAKINKDIGAFLDMHHLDSFYDIGGCETCGPEYEWNCSCGISSDYSGAYGYADHQREAAEKWSPTNGESIFKK